MDIVIIILLIVAFIIFVGGIAVRIWMNKDDE